VSHRQSAVASIRRGYDLHHTATDDADLALLDGDRLYADGLAELATAGDLEAVRVMADVIARSAAALAAGNDADAEAAWTQGIRILGV